MTLSTIGNNNTRSILGLSYIGWKNPNVIEALSVLVKTRYKLFMNTARQVIKSYKPYLYAQYQTSSSFFGLL